MEKKKTNGWIFFLELIVGMDGWHGTSQVFSRAQVAWGISLASLVSNGGGVSDTGGSVGLCGDVEMDYKCLVDMINEITQPNVVIGSLLLDIQCVQKQLRSVEFIFSPCVCNRATHMVASFVSQLGGLYTWDCFESEWLFNTLDYDVNVSIRT
ncbi:hypothetical protein DVH24_003675 [Malus domestica]|uniref:RNase H type-1 domain-containing protein n=1 Tax=Malus domestica TaxID=3750 RepID=A0A498IM63_MALDO|nr:hypothetical protein DVH24_003675 [Malus domestica]